VSDFHIYLKYNAVQETLITIRADSVDFHNENKNEIIINAESVVNFGFMEVTSINKM
jgi:hypothetical protein